MLREVNRILDDGKLTMQNVHVATVDGTTRLVFGVDAGLEERNLLTLRLHESGVFGRVATLGSTERE
jgi:hypothetical protein